jgi:raffinose/stachyose/melibiose transport system permease protein
MATATDAQQRTPPARPPKPPAPAGRSTTSRRPARRPGAEARWRRGWLGPAMVLPALLIFGLYIAWPVVSNVYTSFLGNTELDSTLRFVGIENYEWMAQTRSSQQAFQNVALFAALTIPVQMLLGLVFAVALEGRGALRALLRILLFLPVVLTPVVVGYLYADLLEASSGPLNMALRDAGLGGLAQAWLGDPALVLPVIAFVNVWMWTGFSMAIYQAALTSLDEEVLEAAALDGASRSQTFWRIIVPLLRPAHYSLLILGVIGTLKMFDLVYVLSGGGPDYASEMPTTLLFSTLLDGRDGRAAAIGTVVFLLAMIITAFQLRQYSKGNK